MATLRPPSTSPSPSPGPGGANGNGRAATARASMGPSSRIVSGNGLGSAPSPRPGGISGARPTSELLGGSGVFQTPEADAIDQWFENLQNYEATLEEMAAASLDVNFKEELSAIEQWFRVLSEAERTAALYSLIQHSTQVQIRFFITLLQQMARSDPMTALLSPSVGGGSMQSQMEAKLASMGLKSPSVKTPNSPSRNFTQRQSLALESTTSSSFLSPESALVPPSPGGNNQGANSTNNEAAATLAQQRAKLKANAAHRISAPGTLIAEGNRSMWQSGVGGPHLGQVAESASSSPPPPNSGSSSGDIDSSSIARATLSPGNLSGARPKSTDFSGVADSFSRSVRAESANLDDQLSPMVGGNWASMVNTPLVPMFNGESTTNGGAQANIDAVTNRLANWTLSNNNGGKVQLDDPRKFRRTSRTASGGSTNNGDIYGDDGNLLVPGGPGGRGGASPTGMRNVSGGAGVGGGVHAQLSSQQQQQQNWARASPGGFSNISSGRFGGSDDGRGGGNNGIIPGGFGGLSSPTPQAQAQAAAAAMGLGMNGMNGVPGFGLNGMNMNMLNAMNLQNLQGGIPALNGMNGMNGFNLAAAAAAAGQLSPDAQHQLLSAQIAAAAAFNPAMAGFGMQPGMVNNMGGVGGMRGGNMHRGSGGRSPNSGNKSAGSQAGGKDKDEDVDPSVLNDVPSWLRSLRLHKYTPNFEGMNWRDMVMMDEAALEAKGVAALGARRKMLKTFEVVRAKMGIDPPPGSTNGSATAQTPSTAATTTTNATSTTGASSPTLSSS
ncbi:hypothetical protein SISSUDRAFT_1048552 [Sistotremastrum suecicum HHB10207 ss-3]|uniref:RNA-binding protein VTS1 n=1 Tax=Sistotremastrum suecicum HHB10207 ss-3 TaxID=1314776 RepID=A0A166CDW7_9AGAM|nr:hypothetical protein SISSUDRAFT_1048552 [Sistotremastrum suecicum HHB10207 ss-3]